MYEPKNHNFQQLNYNGKIDYGKIYYELTLQIIEVKYTRGMM